MRNVFVILYRKFVRFVVKMLEEAFVGVSVANSQYKNDFYWEDALLKWLDGE